MRQQPRLVYIAHQVGGDVKGNFQRILEICKDVHTLDTIPFAPYLIALQYLNDSCREERGRGIAANREIFRRKIPDEVWVYGPEISPGIQAEILLAYAMGIPVFCQVQGLEEEVGALVEKHSGKQFELAEKRLVYIAHTAEPDTKANVNEILQICSEVHTDSVIPFAPYLIGLSYLNGQLEKDQALLFAANRSAFARRMMDETFVYGERLSDDVRMMIRWSVRNDIPVYCKSPVMKEAVSDLVHSINLNSFHKY